MICMMFIYNWGYNCDKKKEKEYQFKITKWSIHQYHSWLQFDEQHKWGYCVVTIIYEFLHIALHSSIVVYHVC